MTRTIEDRWLGTTRRGFLRHSLGGAALAALAGRESQSADDRAAPRQTDQGAERTVLERLKGPMASITIPYSKDYSVDHASLRAWVDFMCDRKVPVLFLTYGDSELYNLNEQEVEAVIRTVAKQARGRTLVIGGTPHGWTGQTVDFVNRLEDSGVDAISVHPYSTNEAEVHRALTQVAERTRIPLLAYESKWSLDLVKRVARIPRFVGMKCHAELYRYYDFIRATKDDRFAVLSAGQMKHFLFGYLIGSPAYLCPLAPFAPRTSLRFYAALQSGDIDGARQIIFEFEEPLLAVTIPLGYPQAYKSALQLTGHYATNLVRPPKRSNSTAQIEPLRRLLERDGFAD